MTYYKGVTSPTIMWVEPGTDRVLGPSIPIKASGKPGWQGRPAWVEWINGQWKVLRDQAKIRAVIKSRQKVLERVKISI